MNRFDKGFYGIDNETGRPFSYGRPDGNWIIAILYFMPIFALFVGIPFMIAAGYSFGKVDWPVIGKMASGLVAYTIIVVPAFVLLWRRSKKIISYTVGIIVLLGIVSIVGVMQGNQEASSLTGIILLQLFAFYYFSKQAKQGLLN